MIPKKKINILIAFIILQALASGFCFRTVNNNTKFNTQTKSLLLNKKWRIIKFIIEPGIDNTSRTDVMEMIDDCKKDDYLIFKENGIGESHSGKEKCTDEVDIVTGSWMLEDGNKKIRIYDLLKEDEEEWDIAFLNSNSLKLIHEWSDDHHAFKATILFEAI